MKILAKLTILGSLLFLSGCAQHYGSYARHSMGTVGIRVDAQIPIRAYPRGYRNKVYRDDHYSQHDRRHYYNKRHSDKQYHDSNRSRRHHNQHYSDRRQRGHYSDRSYDNRHRDHSDHRRGKGRYNYWDGKRSRYQSYNHR